MRTKQNASALTHFYKVKNGKFVEFLSEPSETSTSHTTESGKTYHYEEFSKIGGKIERLVLWEDVIKSTNQTIEQLSIYLSDIDGKECLTIPFNSVLCSQILNRLLNITFYNLNEVVFFNVGIDKLKDRSFIWLTTLITGKEEKIPNKYTKDNPKNLPAFEVKKVKGKEIFDNSNQLDFYRKSIEEFNALIS